jgi:predicted dehydrogenase
MIDTVRFLFGEPRAVLALRRVYNRQVGEYSYDFVMEYPAFSMVVQTADAFGGGYNFHVFEVDILTRGRRIRVVDNSRSLLEYGLRDYTYSGVKVFDDLSPASRSTEYAVSMVSTVRYLCDITSGRTPHSKNTLDSSLRDMRIVQAIEKSYLHGRKRIILEDIWKK